MKKALVCLLAVALLAFACAAIAEEETVTITVMDANENVLNEVEVPKGTVVTAEDLGVSREGYVLEGIYVTPAMLRAYDNSPIEADTPLFVAFQSAQVDERPWMLAGSFRGYPDNAWGKVWPQDDYLLQPVEGEFNTFARTMNSKSPLSARGMPGAKPTAWTAATSCPPSISPAARTPLTPAPTSRSCRTASTA